MPIRLDGPFSQDPGVFGSEKNPALVSGERTRVRPVTDCIREGHVMERQK